MECCVEIGGRHGDHQHPRKFDGRDDLDLGAVAERRGRSAKAPAFLAVYVDVDVATQCLPFVAQPPFEPGMTTRENVERVAQAAGAAESTLAQAGAERAKWPFAR